MKIQLGHSPDSDDAFMFWGLSSGAVKSDYEFEHILRDIQTLNDWAMDCKLESSAVSVHAFAHIAQNYALLRHGGSFGEQYGPMIVSEKDISFEDLKEVTIAVPGKLTTAFLQLNLWFKDQYGEGVKPKFEVVPFDQIVPSIKAGKYKAGLIIHESQLTYAEEGLVELVNMGKWWFKKTGLPLPLGVNVVRKDLGDAGCKEVSRCMRESIEASLANREQAVDYAQKYARGMTRAVSDEFVGMYVNERTRDMGDDGIKAIRLILKEGAEIGLVPPVEVQVID
jgi:1,4-dihydroxy-6-naphthoate synthase